MKKLFLFLLVFIWGLQAGLADKKEMSPLKELVVNPHLLVGGSPEISPEIKDGFISSKNTPDFSARGLNYEIELTDIFMGNFEDVPFQREDIFFNNLLGAYVSEYAKYCDSYLPPDKIQLTRQECSQEQVTKNGYGMIISRNCVSYRTVGTGYYAAPDMYAAMETLQQFQLENVLTMIGHDDGLGMAARASGELKAVQMDMAALIKMNGCDSPGLKRFQENLRLFAHGQDPIRLEALIAKRKEDKTEIAGNQDVKSLVEDLVYENSRQWNFNRYQKGSVDNVQILAYDRKGLPGKLKAEYFFTGFSGKQKGSVTVTFDSNGFPDCMYFSDFPTVCRPANRKIVNAYAKNTYRTSGTSSPLVQSEVNSKPLVPSKVNSKAVVTEAPDQEVMEIPFELIENVPVFPGCENEQGNEAKKKCTSQRITEMVHQNFNGELGKKLGLTGINRIIVQFKIDRNGNIGEVRSRAPHPNLEQEAERVVKLLPKMTAGSQRGRPVDVVYSLPIVFDVNNNNKDSRTIPGKKETKKPEPEKISNKKLRELFKVDGNNG